MTDNPSVVMKIGERTLLLPLKVCLSRGHDRGVRVPAVRVARDEDERAGVAGDRLVRARPVGARCRGGPGQGPRRPGRDLQVDRLADPLPDQGRVPDPGPSAPGRRETGLPIPGCFLLPDASWVPGRAGAGRLGHHHRRQAGLHRPGPRHWRVIRRMEGLPRRPA